MATEELKSNEGMDIVIPTLDEEQYSELTSMDMESTLTADEVKAVHMERDSEVDIPSYLLDMSEVENITELSLSALRCLLKGGDTTVYIKNGNNIVKIGLGDGQELYKVFHGVIKNMFNGYKLYYNIGEGFKLVKDTEVSPVRLNLWFIVYPFTYSLIDIRKGSK